MADMPETTAVAKTSRTTPKKKKAVGYDLDAEMLEEFGPPGSDDELPTETLTLYGNEIRVLKTANVFVALQLGDVEEDTSALTRYMISLVHPDDRKLFQSALAKQIDLNVERLLWILRRMTEAVADGNPTSTSSGSRRSARRTGGRALSAAN